MTNDAPLVVTQIVEHEEHDFAIVTQAGEYGMAEDVGGNERALFGMGNPGFVMLAYEFGKGGVGFLFLHGEHLAHGAVSGSKLEFPVHEFAVKFLPLVGRKGIADLHTDTRKFLSVRGFCHFVFKFLSVNVFLERKQNLVGVNRLNEIIRNLSANGLVHDVLRLVFGHHHYGDIGEDVLNARQGFESAQPWHILVEQNKVKRLFATDVEGIRPVRAGGYFVILVLEKYDVGFEKVNFVVHPEKSAEHSFKIRKEKGERRKTVREKGEGNREMGKG